MDENLEKSFIRVAKAMLDEARNIKSTWEPVVKKVYPELVDTAELREDEAHSRQRKICTHARTDIMKLAAAHMSYIFPMGDKWFKLESWRPRKANDATDEIDDWFNRATGTVRREIERSDFYAEMHSACIDSCATGTALLHIDIDDNNDLLDFAHVPAGTFGITRDKARNLKSVARKFLMTPAQLHEEFGYDAMTQEMRQAYDREETRYAAQSSFEIWHLVTPSADFFGEDDDSVLYPYVSAYISPKGDKVLRVEDLEELPYVCIRFLRYGNSSYGVSPLIGVEDTINDLMSAAESQKLLGQRAAIPSVLVPYDMDGEVDLRAGGKTLLPMQYINSQVPREWAPVGNYTVGLDNIERLKKELDDALYVTPLEIISQQDRYMTATEVNSREAERAMTFIPVFIQVQVDVKHLLNRVFALLVRANKILLDENMPQELVQVIPLDGGRQSLRLLNPKISFVGRMAQAMERIQSNGADGFIAKMLQISSALQDPTGPMMLDWQKYWYKEAAIAGIDPEIFKTPGQIKRMMKELEDARQMQQQQQNQVMESEANRNNAAADNFRKQYQQ